MNWKIAILILVPGAALFVLATTTNRPAAPDGSAAQNSSVISTESEWNEGQKDNVLSSGGNISIENKSSEPYYLADLYSEHPEYFSTCSEASMGPAFDGNLETVMYTAIGEGTCDPDPWIGIDLHESKHIGTVYSRSATPIHIHYSTNGVDYTWFGSCDTPPCDPNVSGDYEAWGMLSSPMARYIKLTGAGFSLWEIYFISGATALHTSSPTQITHNDLYEWETFTPNYTKPENTNIEFRFKTSKDSESWTDWTSYQTPASGSPLDISSLVTSREGELAEEDFYKYFQVETRLTSTDGVSTPTLSDYSVGYHTNKPPDKPVAGTVTIGQ